MYFMYVDESGDTGLLPTSSKYYVLSAMVVKDAHWQKLLENLKAFRKHLKQTHDFKIFEEIHAGVLMSQKDKSISRKLGRYQRYLILFEYMKMISDLKEAKLINVCVGKTDKNEGYDIFENAWKALLQRFENALLRNSFSESKDEFGLVMPDSTNKEKLTRLLRKMRVYNPIPSKYGGLREIKPIVRIIEEPFYHDSRHSYFIQTVDVIAYFLYQMECPNKYIKGKGGHNLFERLDNILLREASQNNDMGIVQF